jgi:hypothetical protein
MKRTGLGICFSPLQSRQHHALLRAQVTVWVIALVAPAANEGIQMIFDTTESPLSEYELIAIKQNARVRLRLWKRRSLYSVGAFLLSCVCVYPFVDGRQLSVHGESVKQGLLLLAMALLLIVLYCSLLFWGAWRALRDVEKARI